MDMPVYWRKDILMKCFLYLTFIVSNSLKNYNCYNFFLLKILSVECLTVKKDTRQKNTITHCLTTLADIIADIVL